LDIRQNKLITAKGHNAILGSLERNWDLWCSVMVDDEHFQGKFNALIELNQAGRGDLLRNPSLEKLVSFLGQLQRDPSAIWFFLSIHDTTRILLTDYLVWKEKIIKQNQQKKQEALLLASSSTTGGTDTATLPPPNANAILAAITTTTTTTTVPPAPSTTPTIEEQQGRAKKARVSC
jgi:hypothetical protein